VPLYVPAYVEPATQIASHVLVQAGTNWDLSRTARVTPIITVPDPETEHVPPPPESPPTQFSQADGVPQGQPLFVVHFIHEGVTIHSADRLALLKLPRFTELILAAHGDAHESDANRLSRVRAKAVTNLLRSKGYTVRSVKAFGSSRPAVASAGEPTSNRCVQVFAASTAP
jgi:hypothetical protein